MLQVIEKDSVLVVDSRLIAEELGIEHRSFKDTVQGNITDLELHFGELRRETASSKANGGGGFGETYYLLNEEQATYLMTLSRNTDQVKKAKLSLVKAFSAAKSALKNIDNNALISSLNNLANLVTQQQQQLNTLTERTQQLDIVTEENKQLTTTIASINTAGLAHQGCYNIIQSELTKEDTTLITAYDFLLEVNQPTEYAQLLARRAASLFRCSRKAEPFKNKQNQLLFERKYLREALTSIADLLVD
jgi:phage regulator Rha-like protein